MWPYTTQERNWLVAGEQPAAQAPLAVPVQQMLPFTDGYASVNSDNAPYDPMIFVAK